MIQKIKATVWQISALENTRGVHCSLCVSLLQESSDVDVEDEQEPCDFPQVRSRWRGSKITARADGGFFLRNDRAFLRSARAVCHSHSERPYPAPCDFIMSEQRMAPACE